LYLEVVQITLSKFVLKGLLFSDRVYKRDILSLLFSLSFSWKELGIFASIPFVFTGQHPHKLGMSVRTV